MELGSAHEQGRGAQVQAGWWSPKLNPADEARPSGTSDCQTISRNTDSSQVRVTQF
jgi:hypothetical protein